MTTDPQWPRRSCLDRMTPAELAIRAAMIEVEKVGADVRLTDAVSLLVEAQAAVADYEDGKREIRRGYAHRPWQD